MNQQKQVINYNATGKVTEKLLHTVFNDKPIYEKIAKIEGQEEGAEGQLLSGTIGIVLVGGFRAGKTTDIIKMFEMLCMYQEPYKGKRQIHIGVLRNTNADFVDTLGKSFGYWYDEHSKKNFQYGFRIANQHTRPEVTVRFPSVRYKRQSDNTIKIVREGIDCEIVYFCYASNKKDDEKRMKGGEFTCTWSNEGNITSKAAHEMITGRNDRYPPIGATRSLWIMDLNPTHKKSWEYLDYVQTKMLGVLVIKYTSAIKFTPDPKGNASLRGIIGRYEINPETKVHGSYSYFFNQLTKSETFITNNVLGEYTDIVEGHVVHPAFDPEKHIKEKKVAQYQTLGICVDFGVKCGYCIITQDDDGRVHVSGDGWCDTGFRTLYNKQIKPYIEKAHKMQNRDKNCLFIGDPRTARKKDLINADTSVSILEKDNFEYTVPTREDGAIVDNINYRVDTVNEYLEHDMITISPACEMIIDAFSFGYIKNEITGLPDKIKSGMHAEVMDALQYGLTYISLGGYLEANDYHNENIEIFQAY